MQEMGKVKKPHTNWIVKDGLRKLKETNKKEVNKILNLVKKLDTG